MGARLSPPPHIFQPAYYQRLYDIEEQHWWALGMRRAMRELLRASLTGRTGLRVLDAGCGTGYMLHYLQQHYSLTGTPVGIDLSPYALKFCQQRGASALAQASVVHLPFQAASFDLVLCLDTLQHLSPAGADCLAVAEFARVLRPGGVLYLRTNSALGHAPLHGTDPHQYRRYHLTTVTGLLMAAGLVVERATYLNMLPGAWAMLREYCRGALPHPTPASGPGLSLCPYPRQWLWLNKVMQGVLQMEAWLVGPLRLNLPFGHAAAFVARKQESRASCT
jgi:ubiquinone/menaquinone biosynthesis C-methylase UbiE